MRALDFASKKHSCRHSHLMSAAQTPTLSATTTR
jgi:hypothetical protein